MGVGCDDRTGERRFRIANLRRHPMNLFVTLLAAFLLQVYSASAVVLVDLPELTGDYSIGDSPPPSSPWTRSTAFAFPDSIESVEGLRFVISGSWTSGKIVNCLTVGEYTYCDTLPTSTNLTLRLTADPLGACHFQATIPAYTEANGSELLVEFCAEGQSDVNLLLGSVVSAELFCDVVPESIPNIVEATFGTVTEARLETVGAVPVKKPTWGSVKSLYR